MDPPSPARAPPERPSSNPESCPRDKPDPAHQYVVTEPSHEVTAQAAQTQADAEDELQEPLAEDIVEAPDESTPQEAVLGQDQPDTVFGGGPIRYDRPPPQPPSQPPSPPPPPPTLTTDDFLQPRRVQGHIYNLPDELLAMIFDYVRTELVRVNLVRSVAVRSVAATNIVRSPWVSALFLRWTSRRFWRLSYVRSHTESNESPSVYSRITLLQAVAPRGENTMANWSS
ncbi:hypothetical protein QBC47DRAFT_404510 [Echria macrotheca]|uniref:Uncharacterized protein n=1 Tax=Echria macrotheca TaxID=438768 RepID=A0AAJ0B7L2_9PEZI|nr:hypothetical protein QBC47DRAFT_404510 [Echria macrotheca]